MRGLALVVSFGGYETMKKFLIIVIGVAALLAVLEAVEMVRFDK